MVFDKLWWKQRKLQKTRAFYDPLLRKANLAGNREEIDHINQEAAYYERLIYDDIQVMYSEQIQRQCKSLGVAIAHPVESDYWIPGHNPYVHFLTIKAQNELRKEIIQRQAERRAAIAVWMKDVVLPIGCILVGLVGGAIGYYALTHAVK